MTTKQLLGKRFAQIQENNKLIDLFQKSWNEEKQLVENAIKLNKDTNILIQMYARLSAIKEIKSQLKKLKINETSTLS